MKIGKAHQLLTFLFIQDGKQEVVEYTAFNTAKVLLNQSLFQEEAHEWGLIVLKAQLSEALQDTSDAQVVVHIPARDETVETEITNKKLHILEVSYLRIFEYLPLKVSKALLPVLRSLHFTRLFVDQTDAIKTQHEFIGLD